MKSGKVRIFYRAMSNDNTSVVGYASSADGVHITKRLPEPVYVPREDFESKAGAGRKFRLRRSAHHKDSATRSICATRHTTAKIRRAWRFTSIALPDMFDHKWDVVEAGFDFAAGHG